VLDAKSVALRVWYVLAFIAQEALLTFLVLWCTLAIGAVGASWVLNRYGVFAFFTLWVVITVAGVMLVFAIDKNFALALVFVGTSTTASFVPVFILTRRRGPIAALCVGAVASFVAIIAAIILSARTVYIGV
jgi:hypothetical protein